VGIQENKDVAPPFEGSASRVALERTDLLDEDELLIRRSRDEVYIRVIAMHDLATGETRITWVGWGNMWIRTASTEQCLCKALSQQCLTDALWACEKIGVPNLLCSKCAAQNVYGVLVSDDIPVLSLC
jgi:hypothetical protein